MTAGHGELGASGEREIERYELRRKHETKQCQCCLDYQFIEYPECSVRNRKSCGFKNWQQIKVLNEKIKKLCGRSVFSFVLSVHTILTSVRSALRFLRLSLSPS